MSEESEALEITNWGDPEDPRSFINIIPENIVDRVHSIPQKYLDMDEDELYESIPLGRRNSTRMVRQAFWNEYEFCSQDGRRKISSNRINKRFNNNKLLYRVFNTPNELAFMLRPIEEYKLALLDVMSLGFREMRKIMEAPMELPTGMICPKIADVKRRVFDSMADRARGMPVQHLDIQQKNLNVNIEGGSRDVTGPQSVEEIDEQIRQLEAKSKDIIESSGGVIEGKCEKAKD